MDEIGIAAGYCFTFGNRKIGSSRPMTAEEVAAVPYGKRNKQDDFPMFVKCRKCGVYMDYTPSMRKYEFGHWTCPVCKVNVRELTAYNQLDREIKAEDEKWQHEFGTDYDEF